jgi:hypothetical protein
MGSMGGQSFGQGGWGGQQQMGGMGGQQGMSGYGWQQPQQQRQGWPGSGY